MPKLKLLIWDFDGTLGYQKNGYFSGSLLQSIRKDNPQTDLTIEQIRPLMQADFPWQMPERPHTHIRTPDEWWARLNPVFERACIALGFDQARAAEYAARVRGIYTDLQNWGIFEDTVPTLQRLKDRGWSHILLSNHAPELTEILSYLGIDQYLEAVFNSAQTGYEKPHPSAYRIALAAFPQADPVWMIGDTPTADVYGARAAGLRAILVRNPHPRVEPFAADLSAVEEILEREMS